MLILDEPNVSPQLRRAATRLGAPVLDNPCARRELRGVQLVGDEFAVDAYYDDDGAVTIVNVLEHPFAHGADVSDRLYRVRPAVIERTHDVFVQHLDELDQLDEILRADLTEYVRLA